MFLLSIVPIHLSTDSDRVAVNNANSVDVAEHRVMQLEALYSALIMRQYLGREITGVSNLFLEGVRNELVRSRNAELELMNTTNTTADNDSFARLNEVTRMQQMVNQRIADLQALYMAVSSGGTLDRVITGVDNTNIRSISNELGYAIQYRTELELSQQFWTQITQGYLLMLQGGNQDQSGDNNSTTGNNTNTTGNTTSGNNQTGNQNNNGNTSGEMTTERMASIAESKRNIFDWQSLLDSLDSGQSIEQIDSIEAQIKQEMSIELYKARTQYNDHAVFTQESNPSMQRFAELNNQLKFIGNLRSKLQMLNGVQDTATNAMSRDINNANSYS